MKDDRFLRAEAARAYARPLLGGWRTGWLVIVLSLIGGGLSAGPARAAGDASAAAAFVENAQNSDGGFGATRGHRSSPDASLWATVALLAAGKNPQDEQLNNGASADAYLAAHLAAYRSLTSLGLLAIVQSAAGLPPARYGQPDAQLRSQLSPAGIHSDPGGAALGILGLLAVNGAADRRVATTAARTLLTAADGDGGWGVKLSSSAATALALQAIAQSGVAGAGDPVVKQGLSYLHRAQVNDGSVATSDRTDPSSTGNVAATAFAAQALTALRVPALRTSTGTTLLQGLANYQQQGTGGLSPFGAYDTGVAPSVVQTAQAYPAFDGVTFPLPSVPSTNPRPVKRNAPAPAPPRGAANRASVGTTSRGVSSGAASGTHKVAAFKGASAASGAKSRGKGTPAAAGTAVTGAVVGATQPPKLTTRSGRPPAADRSGLLLAGGLLALALLGACLDARRPRGDGRSPTAVGVQKAADLLAAARARGALAPSAVLLVGAALILLPSATHMWSRAPKGAKLIRAFSPYMQPTRLERRQLDVAQINAGVREAATHGPRLQFPKATNARSATRQFASADPAFALFATQWPAIDRRYRALLDPMQANRSNYDAIAALPSFTLFPWLFVVPGALLAVLALGALLYPRHWRGLRAAVIVVGAGLVLAPVAFHMFARAPRGARLLTAFRSVETHGKVTAAQNDFASLAIGQGALGSELVPALRHGGATPPQIARALPAVTTLDRRFVAILGDLTPTLGVMGDNVVNYQAVAALPSFSLFPWLFAIPGLAVCGLALLPVARRPATVRRQMPAEAHAATVINPDTAGAP